MQNFDIAKYLREHQLGSYGILNHYVDLKPLKEVDDTTEVELNTEIPYEGPEHKLTGNGEGDEFEQAETVSEEDSMGANRIMDIGGNSIEKAIFRLKDSGFDAEDVENLFKVLMSHHFGTGDGMEDEEDLY